MTQTHIALSLFFVLFVIVLPFIIKKYNIKDDVKHKNTLPIGTAKFRAFLKLTYWVVVGFLLLTLVLSTLNLMGLDL